MNRYYLEVSPFDQIYALLLQPAIHDLNNECCVISKGRTQECPIQGELNGFIFNWLWPSSSVCQAVGILTASGVRVTL